MSDATPLEPLPAPKTKRGERTRQKILDAAEREIGRKGFSEASISTITAEAAVGQGTFYLYFRTKEDVLRELVLRMGRRLRRHLTLAVADAPSRLEAERLGLRAFLEFVRANPDLYRVVAESQFVDQAVFRRYYQEFAAGYRFARGGEARVTPYVGGGFGVYNYQEESDFDDPQDDEVSFHKPGYLGMAGLEFKVSRRIWTAVDVQYSRVPGILGDGGLSGALGEDDLGGFAVRFRLMVGN